MHTICKHVDLQNSFSVPISIEITCTLQCTLALPVSELLHPAPPQHFMSLLSTEVIKA